MARFPDEVARLRLLEADEKAISTATAALQSFQRGCSDSAVVARFAKPPPAGPTRGAAGPTPVRRASTLQERAANFKRVYG
jgi:hypothetical protein